MVEIDISQFSIWDKKLLPKYLSHAVSIYSAGIDR